MNFQRENTCDSLVSNTIDIHVKSNDCEVRADIVLNKADKLVRLWGQVKDQCGKPVANTLIKLLKVKCSCGKIEYEGVAHTVSDCEGFYQFDIEPLSQDCDYKLLVGKSAYGKERNIKSTGNCPPQNDCSDLSPSPCNPCKPYDLSSPCNQGYKCNRMNDY